MKKLFLFFLLLAGLLGAHGQAGSLDPTFAGKGWTLTDFLKGNSGTELGQEVLTQHDGSSIIVFDRNRYVMIARYLPDGTLDMSFGEEGFTTAVDMTYATSLLQPDGKIVIAGGVELSFILVRFNADGSLDNTFDGDGKVITDFSEYGFPTDMALQSDGKIVVVGQSYSPVSFSPTFTVVRYNTNGSLDASFDGDGIVITDLSPTAERANSVAIQSDGKIVVAGYAQHSMGINGFALVRYLSNGSLDNTFDGDGKLITDVDPLYGIAGAIAIQNDGKIVAGGQYFNTGTHTYQVWLARFNPNGTLDPTFDGDGKVITEPATDHYFGAIALQNDGKILVTGHFSIGTTDFSDAFILRYNTNGSLDNTFSGDGRLTTDFGYEDYPVSITVQANGLIAIGGYAYVLIPEENTDFILAQYNADGSPNNTFSGDGKLLGYYTVGLPSTIRDIAVQSDGKIIVAGRVADPSTGNANIGLARYHPDGTLDPSFSGDGKVTTDFGSLDETAYAVAVQSDGKIVVAGEAYFNSKQIIVARYNQDGTLDPSFDGDGKVVTNIGTGASAYAIALSGNKIVVAGGAYNFSENAFDFAVVRYLPDGSLDNTFDGDGIAITDLRDNDQAFSLAVQSDGKVVVAGGAYISSNADYEIAIVRYNTDGSLDNNFDGDGKLTGDYGGYEYARAIAIQSDGKIVVAGEVNYDFALLRYQPNGSLDASFSGDGMVTTNFGYEEAAWDLVIQGDGKIVATGGTYNPSTSHSDFALARYLPDGTLDVLFDGDGKVVTDFGYDEFASAAAIYSGRLYAAGSSTGVTDIGSVLERGLIAAYRLGATGAEICGNKIDDNGDGQIDEGCAGLPFLTIDDVSVSESERRAVVTVSLSKKTAQKVFVDYFTRGGTARTKAFKNEGKDYEAASGTLSIPVGKQSVSFVVKITSDDVWEKDEFFKVQLHKAVGATIRKAQATVTIVDDDQGLQVAPEITGITAKEEEKGVGALAVQALPNPAASYFTLVVQGSGTATIRVTDAAGRLVESRQGVAANATLQVGHSYQPGVYYAEVVQGKERVVVKLVKRG